MDGVCGTQPSLAESFRPWAGRKDPHMQALSSRIKLRGFPKASHRPAQGRGGVLGSGEGHPCSLAPKPSPGNSI